MKTTTQQTETIPNFTSPLGLSTPFLFLALAAIATILSFQIAQRKNTKEAVIFWIVVIFFGLIFYSNTEYHKYQVCLMWGGNESCDKMFERD
ncbi:MAG: hypothetical protein C6Y22_29255 [Hapalosiphonaceae cyanobacterium JJU2]|nr:MAG: hypothetical protein C6Y22_29255 [Hapalosiphonaceae cyanobacterium JJU2]